MQKSVLGLFLAGGLASCVVAPSGPIVDAQNRVVDIVNTTDTAVAFYAINAERRGVFRGHFAAQEISQHDYTTINFNDGSGACLFDFYAAFPDGSSAEQRRFNTCAEVSWVLNAEIIQ